jgi:hypothetical protein
MPDYTVKADVDSMLRADNDAGIRTAIGLGQTDAPTFAGTSIQSQTDAAHTFRVRNIAGYDLITINTSTRNVTLAGDAFNFSTSTGNFSSYNAGAIAWSDGSTATGGTLDLFIRRDGAAGILAQRNGSAAQTQRTYNNYTSATVFERGTFGFPIGTNRLRIGTEFLGAGMAALPIDFVTGDVVRMSIAAAGTTNFTGAASFNSSITCVSDFNGERDIYCGTNRYFRFNVGGATALSSSAAGVVTMADLGATNTTPRITLGGTTSAFPAIKRNGTGIDIVLANDSAFAPLSSGNFTSDSSISAAASSYIMWGGGTSSRMSAPSNGVIQLTNAATTSFTRLEFGTANLGISRGTGSPEGIVTALVGSLYLRTDGGLLSTLYVKESSPTPSTGWVAK